MCKPELLDNSSDKGAPRCSVPDTNLSVKQSFPDFECLQTHLAAMAGITRSFDSGGHDSGIEVSGSQTNDTTR